LLEALQARLARPPRELPTVRPPPPSPPQMSIVGRLDLSLAMDPSDYERRLLKYQARLNEATRRMRDAQRRSMIIVLEGPDAAGKGGAIRRLTAAMDARDYQVMSVAAPTDEERARPYLWRFWRRLPPRGRVTIYDRSWYGRVLVERIEGFCADEDWNRAYAEINAFEEQLVESGTVIAKFWIAVSPEEQLRRFRERQETPYKQYKLTDEDWRNRDKWQAYEAAACDMIGRTSTELAGWTLVEGDNKEWARIKVMRTVVKTLERALDEDE
jgi:polyphosphate kinase 2 (PPK2 family)